ncbi:MAG: beta-phosphoglucomutase family hydrolase [Chlamydiales bacterium]
MEDQNFQYKRKLSRAKFDGIILDLDGVVTQSTKVHAAAWKEMFDTYLSQRGKREGKDYDPFDRHHDYMLYIDGKPRYEGVKSFLKTRGIELPWGSLQDPWDAETICGLGNWKNQLFQKHLLQEGVEVYTTSVDLIIRLRERGFKIALVSSSKNCSQILKGAHIAHLFDAQVDGLVAEKKALRGKPHPDVFLLAANMLDVKPEKAVVVEDSLAGVESGKRGHFGLVIGVDRLGHREDLKQAGADIVISDLKEIEII